MNHTIDPDAFQAGWDLALSASTGLCVGTFLYGILLVLVGMAAHLLNHWTGAGRKILAAATVAMAILATAQIALLISSIILQLQFVRLDIEGEPSPRTAVDVYRNIEIAEDILFLTNNHSLVADGLFIYRCFIIWGHNARVVALPILMLISTAGCSAAYLDIVVSTFKIDLRVVVVMGLATNIVLMGFTAAHKSLMSWSDLVDPPGSLCRP
ncbi:hypothetical protein DFH06DRAFT_1364714 [Mycena polygramma]|nr:hypothetical protein DFH06DRAFT_1364714 [Mycena polygramma]